MTYDSWKTTEPSPDDDDLPCEMPDDHPGRICLAFVEHAIAAADRRNLHATITLRITSPDGSVVDVTKQSEMARRGR